MGEILIVLCDGSNSLISCNNGHVDFVFFLPLPGPFRLLAMFPVRLQRASFLYTFVDMFRWPLAIQPLDILIPNVHNMMTCPRRRYRYVHLNHDPAPTARLFSAPNRLTTNEYRRLIVPIIGCLANRVGVIASNALSRKAYLATPRDGCKSQIYRRNKLDGLAQQGLDGSNTDKNLEQDKTNWKSPESERE